MKAQKEWTEKWQVLLDSKLYSNETTPSIEKIKVYINFTNSLIYYYLAYEMERV